ELQRLLVEPVASFLGPTGTADDCQMLVVADQLWANVNRPGGGNARHNHGSATRALVASGVYFPKSASTPLRFFPKGEAEVEAVPEAGVLWLFPPGLDHAVATAPPGSGTRVSIAFNLQVRWLDTPLHCAASAGAADQLRELASRGADLGQVGKAGLQAVHLAAEAGHLSSVEALVGLGADASAVSPQGWSALGLAADRGHVDVVRYLYGRGFLGTPARKDDPADTGRPPQIGLAGAEKALAVAAERGHVSIVKLLVKEGNLPLSLAITAGHSQIVRLLLAEGAEPHGTVGNRRPIHIAAGSGHVSVTELLIDANVDLDSRDGSGKAAAHEAVAQGHLSTLQVLLDALPRSSWNIDAGDQEDICPLHTAAIAGHMPMVASLVAAGASMDAIAKGRYPGRPLHWAAGAGHAAVVEQLLGLGADVCADAGFAAQTSAALAGDRRAAARVSDSAELVAAATAFTRSGDVFERVKKAEVLGRRKVQAAAADEA
ncbi:unnamed protein product, partial [Polarella glacialis]